MGASRSAVVLSLALGCASQEAIAPEVAAPAIALDSGAGARATPAASIGKNDKEAQRCFASARRSGGAADGPCADDTPAACAQRCSEGEAHACQRLAQGFSKSGDKGCADKLFDLSCTHGEHGACVALTQLLDASKDGARIAKLLSRSCDAGHGPGCTRLGARVLDEGDRTRGERLLMKACDKGDAEGCRRAAALREDEGERVQLVRKACQLGDPRACIDLARTNRGEASQILQQACALDSDEDRGESCFLLGTLTRQTGAVAQSDALHVRACDKGHSDACINVVTNHYNAGRYDDAIKLAAKLIATDGSNSKTREVRGLSLFQLGRFSEALVDLEQMCTLRPDDIYCHLWLFAARERSGVDGKRALAAVATSFDTSRWPGHVVPFFLGKLSEAELMRAAKHAERQKELEQLCEAYFYAGQVLMIRGKTKQAAALFQKSIDTGVTNFYEFGLSRSELARLAP